MRILLIRHGLTELGEQKRYQGSLDTPLSEKGRKQLKDAGEHPELVIVSPMLRARETADALFPGAPQVLCEDLKEMNFGSFEGRAWWEMENDPFYRAWVDGGCIGFCPGGEDKAGFSGRVCRAFDQMMKKAFAEGLRQIAVIAHGGTQMAVLEKWGYPERVYYRWQTACGHGWELTADRWPGELKICGEVDFTV